MTFAQLSARLKNFLKGWLLVLDLKEVLVKCATVCVKSVVILRYLTEESLSLFQGICDTETAREYFRTSTVTPAESTTTSTTTQRYLKIFRL